MADNTILNRSKFALLAECSRQNIKKKVDDGTLILNDDNKLDINNPENKFWLEQRKNKTKLKINNPGKTVSVEKQKVSKVVKSNKKPSPGDSKKDDPEIEEPLQKQKLKIEVEKLIEQRDKLKRENAIGRADLIDRMNFSDRIFDHLAALHKNIMGMPAGYIDDMEAGIKAKYTRSQLINIGTIPICEAIAETKSEIKKDINRMIKQVRR